MHGVDVPIQAPVLNLMKRLQVDHGLTYVLISHHLSVVRSLAGRIGVRYLGKLVELGHGDDVYRRPVHPYTAGLLATEPLPNLAARSRRTSAPRRNRPCTRSPTATRRPATSRCRPR